MNHIKKFEYDHDGWKSTREKEVENSLQRKFDGWEIKSDLLWEELIDIKYDNSLIEHMDFIIGKYNGSWPTPLLKMRGGNLTHCHWSPIDDTDEIYISVDFRFDLNRRWADVEKRISTISSIYNKLSDIKSTSYKMDMILFTKKSDSNPHSVIYNPNSIGYISKNVYPQANDDQYKRSASSIMYLNYDGRELDGTNMEELKSANNVNYIRMTLCPK